MRTYKTLSLSLPPGVVAQLAAVGRSTGRVAARVAAEIVLREAAKQPSELPEGTRRRSWCCQAPVISIDGPMVVPEKHDPKRTWIPVVVFLCGACRRQLHGCGCEETR